jgi:hypothetical protein
MPDCNYEGRIPGLRNLTASMKVECRFLGAIGTNAVSMEHSTLIPGGGGLLNLCCNSSIEPNGGVPATQVFASKAIDMISLKAAMEMLFALAVLGNSP